MQSRIVLKVVAVIVTGMLLASTSAFAAKKHACPAGEKYSTVAGKCMSTKK